MRVSKVDYSGETLIDLTSDTVTEETLLEGATAHSADGESISGAVATYAGENVETGEAGGRSFLESVFQVGSLYLSMVGTNPTLLFGFGTWEQIQDTFLLAAGSTYSAGSTGGEASHVLTANEVPDLTITSANGQIYTDYVVTAEGTVIRNFGTVTVSAYANPIYADGGGRAHNNMPPYLAVYVWVRTA